MNGGINIDPAPAIQYAVDKALGLFGKDQASQAAMMRTEKRLKAALAQAGVIRCVGMHRRIPIERIYQPAMLSSEPPAYGHGSAEQDESRRGRQTPIGFEDLIEAGESAVVLGGPGSGKSVLLNWTLLKLGEDKARVPLLFTLRSPRALEDLRSFVDALRAGRVVRKKSLDVVLLVDGYDEIGFEQRKEVSQILLEFDSLGRGNYYLTCRLFYDIIDLPAPWYYVQPFSREDALRFMTVFLEEYDAQYDAEQLVDEIEARGFVDFLSNPLLLALVCISMTGPLRMLPRHTIGLLERAVDTLTLRWDESRGIARESRVLLDGHEHRRCLERIAYELTRLVYPETVALAATREHLELLQMQSVAPKSVLREMARWYGIFVPVAHAEWAFVHKTLHDFLAACYWVQSGEFLKSGFDQSWSTRVAYAACRMPNSTKILNLALAKSMDLEVLTECLGNNARFDAREVSASLVRRLGNPRMQQYDGVSRVVEGDRLAVSIREDFVQLMSDEFLRELLQASVYHQHPGSDVAYALALSEVKRRGLEPPVTLRRDFSHVHFTVTRAGRESTFKQSDLLGDAS